MLFAPSKIVERERSVKHRSSPGDYNLIVPGNFERTHPFMA